MLNLSTEEGSAQGGPGRFLPSPFFRRPQCSPHRLSESTTVIGYTDAIRQPDTRFSHWTPSASDAHRRGLSALPIAITNLIGSPSVFSYLQQTPSCDAKKRASHQEEGWCLLNIRAVYPYVTSSPAILSFRPTELEKAAYAQPLSHTPSFQGPSHRIQPLRGGPTPALDKHMVSGTHLSRPEFRKESYPSSIVTSSIGSGSTFSKLTRIGSA